MRLLLVLLLHTLPRYSKLIAFMLQTSQVKKNIVHLRTFLQVYILECVALMLAGHDYSESPLRFIPHLLHGRYTDSLVLELDKFSK